MVVCDCRVEWSEVHGWRDGLLRLHELYNLGCDHAATCQHGIEGLQDEIGNV